ncbi:MAG: DUF2807 domain-containing protein [Prevotella sp.]|nr:DUF2807 domain-containing protein [Prevotella sp.]
MKLLFMACGLALALMNCQAEKNMVINTPSGETTTYQLRDFTCIDAGGVVRVQFTQGQNYSVEVVESGDPNLETKVEKKGKTLRISTKTKTQNANNSSNEYPVVRITAPQLEGIVMSGVALFNAATVNGNQLNIDVSGASKMEIGQLKYNRVTLDCSGASKLTAAINADDMYLDCSGASKLALNTEGKTMKVSNSGASKCDITFVGGSIDFDNSGAGKVDLKLVDCQELKAHNSGASKFVISGNADKTMIDASGVSKIDTSHLNQY